VEIDRRKTNTAGSFIVLGRAFSAVSRGRRSTAAT
jgi:hypothetical protein